MSLRRRPGMLRRLGGWIARRLNTGGPKAAQRQATLERPSIDLQHRRGGQPAPSTLPKRPPKPAQSPADIAARAAPASGIGPDGLRSLETVVEGARIHAAERPSAAGADSTLPTVILIHGAGLDHRDWTFSFMAALPPELRVLAFDRPGFGRSERPRGAASALPATQARLLRGAAVALGVKRAILVGHSWGGAVVMAWALDAPERLAGVVSIAGAVAPWSLTTAIENGRRMHEAALRAMGKGGMREASVEALRESFAPAQIPSGYIEHVATELNPLTGPAAATMADISTINGALSLMAPRYKALQVPVELVYGDADRILPYKEQVCVADTLSSARVTLLPGVGHMAHHSARAACLTSIDRLSAVG